MAYWAAITFAIEAEKSGKSVIIVSPEKYLGGLSSVSIGFTDTGDKSVIGGLVRGVSQSIICTIRTVLSGTGQWQRQSEYRDKGQRPLAIDGNERSMWIFELYIVEQVFEGFVKEYELEI